jgi:hypothetical protein
MVVTITRNEPRQPTFSENLEKTEREGRIKFKKVVQKSEAKTVAEPSQSVEGVEALIQKSASATQRDGETQAQAYNRTLTKNPALYQAYLIAKQDQLTDGGNQNAREEFQVFAILKSVQEEISIEEAMLKYAKENCGVYAAARLAGLQQVEGMPC